MSNYMGRQKDSERNCAIIGETTNLFIKLFGLQSEQICVLFGFGGLITFD